MRYFLGTSAGSVEKETLIGHTYPIQLLDILRKVFIVDKNG
jgi:hypothetical protein